MPRRLWAVIAALLCALSTRAQAQDTTAPASSHRTRKTAVTLNPFALFATYFAGDIETTVKPMLTLGVGGSYNGVSDYNNYRSFEAKVRYYPQETALVGFSIAGTVGVASARDNGYVAYDATGQQVTFGPASGQNRTTRATVGTELSYQWILGPSRRFVAVGGVGVKRLLGSRGYADPIDSEVLPTARISIGIAF